MNTQELAKAVADRTGTTPAQARTALDAAVDVITDTLLAGGEVRVERLAVFKTTLREAGTYRDLRTQETRPREAFTAPKVTFSQILRARLRKHA